MKALTIITVTATMLLILAIEALANDSIGKAPGKETATIALPEFVWGTPEDIDAAAAQSLKYSNISAPEFKWGSAADLDLEAAEILKYSNIEAPEFVWGSPEDLNEKSVEELKNGARVALPEFAWGNPEDLDSTTVEGLKNAFTNIPFPEIELANPQELQVEYLKK